ncbi:MAG TPA: magnesium-translocating P-type ATPase [Devosia sp.]|nr:magnesium-translocating P-type ATPase [Devosia sp.]
MPYQGLDHGGARLPEPAPPDPTLAAALGRLQASANGLTGDEAAARRVQYGPNRLREDDGNHPLGVLFRQFRSPMVLILLGAAILSFALGEVDEAIIVTTIIVASTGLGFSQEYRASKAVAELRRRIAVSVLVHRDGHRAEVQTPDIVPGDILELRAGSLIPADAIVLEASALQVDEAVLTGESFPASKTAAQPSDPLRADNRIHMGTSVRSGEATVLVTETGSRTEFGGLANSLAATEPETSFARGLRRFGLLMTQIMFVLVTLVLIANVLLGRPVLDSLLFAAALAVGITPELLPAIVTVTLSQGAKRLIEKGVLVRRLVSIENLGTMDLICTDKTGTLTVGDVCLERAIDVDGNDSSEVLRWAVLNSSMQTALPNALDTAILGRKAEVDCSSYSKRGEVPYDFDRKRLSVVLSHGADQVLACKGATDSVLSVCETIASGGLVGPLTEARRAAEGHKIAAWGQDGRRVIALANKIVASGQKCGPADESDLCLVGYLLFSDPLKPGIAQIVGDLDRNGIELRIISGDNRYVAAHVASAVGLTPKILVGADLVGLADSAFARRIADVNVFAEVTPSQKERIVSALKATHTVGYMGDGINDAPSLRAADIGISVDNAVDAARAAADVILLKQDLEVLLDGIIAGRTAFGNTIKYIGITISSNFGNMISMAAASILLPFLPMLATQVLLNNLLADLPMLAISTDRIDAELLARPRQWDFRALIRSMLGFGLVSSVFDGITFLVLLQVFHASASLFQTAWFMESLLTQLAVIAVMRTRKPFFESLPSRLLIGVALAVAAVAVALPFVPIVNSIMGFVPLPFPLLETTGAIVVAYVAASELVKRRISLLGPSVRFGAAA